jgi:hypothetical protein
MRRTVQCVCVSGREEADHEGMSIKYLSAHIYRFKPMKQWRKKPKRMEGKRGNCENVSALSTWLMMVT